MNPTSIVFGFLICIVAVNGGRSNVHISTFSSKDGINTYDSNSKLVPNLNFQELTKCIPGRQSLNVTLSTGDKITRCSAKNDSLTLSRKAYSDQPQRVQYSFAENKKRYTLVAYSSSTLEGKSTLEWLVANIKASDLKNGDVSNGQLRKKYKRAVPREEEDTIHTFAIFEETVKNQVVHIPETRLRFAIDLFLTQQPDTLIGPIATAQGKSQGIY